MRLLSRILNRPRQTDNSPQKQDGNQPTQKTSERLVKELIKVGEAHE